LLDCPADESDTAGMLALLVVVGCYAAGLLMHRRFHVRRP
jgi:hypothetical protein